jgi:hypothetical protein
MQKAQFRTYENFVVVKKVNEVRHLCISQIDFTISVTFFKDLNIGHKS